MMTETVVIVAIAILAIIFAASLITLLLVCRHKYCRKLDLLTNHFSDTRPEVNLISSCSMDPICSDADVELGEVTMKVTNLENLLEDERWVDDATGLVPHCIKILKTCHKLTERMVAMTMNNARRIRTQETLTDIVTVVKKIGPRVDEVVRAMYPPLDSRLLEARCTALVLSVSHLVMMTKHVCRLSGQLDWIDQSLADVEDSLAFLREASTSGDSSKSPSDMENVSIHDYDSGIHSNSSYTEHESSQV